MDGSRAVGPGQCIAWPLPVDASCAGVARRLYREAIADLTLAPELVDDGLMMVSELAANTLHSRHARPAVPGCPELWLYLRGQDAERELVCKVFDCCPGWKHGRAPAPAGFRAPADAVSGRGLQLVNELSGGRWGHHLTRARLGGWRVRGKAVWFAQPAAPAAAASYLAAPAAGPPGDRAPGPLPSGPPSAGPRMTQSHAAGLSLTSSSPVRSLAAAGAPQRPGSPGGVPARDLTLSRVSNLRRLSTMPLDRVFVREASPDGNQAAGFAASQSSGRHQGPAAGQAVAALESALRARGFGGRLVRADDPAADMAVLSVCGGLTVWCRAGTVWLRGPRGDSDPRRQWTYADLVEVAEQTVQAYEYVVIAAATCE